MEEYFILSLKWSQHGDCLVWYRPNSCGYTLFIEEAGRYTKEEALKCSHKNITVAVPVDYALSLARKIIYADDKSKLIEKRLKVPRKAKTCK